MNAITILVSALCLAVLQFSVQAESAHAFWFLPSAPITRFQSTMVVPSTPGGGLHAVWPGLENESEGFVFQSVLSDSNGAGSWTFFVEYCCNPNYVYTPIKGSEELSSITCFFLTGCIVYPGDSITSTFSLDNGLWTDAWSLTPGATGSSNGQIPQIGSSSNSFCKPLDSPLQRRLLTNIELKSQRRCLDPRCPGNRIEGRRSVGFWRGSMDRYLCNGFDDFTMVYGTTALNYQISGGVQSSSGPSTTCTYQSLQFIGPS
ncbi:hypothetical protein LSUB1_G007981 [Lachnellula subtilissima]|uniref:Uncharacterized protein n=1 Tax=Lachnellula subtilissima TaxID=602034 RepID=A0A8H8RG46_9HELO|nr:hypothetical protein LSUB1_G007981 [Lachnellula subtilissima]